MGKALMVSGVDNCSLSTLSGYNLFGWGGISIPTVEANAQVSCTEGATFSKLGVNIISGGSGTNNFQFRDAGADGNQLASRAGTGTAEDATNTDVLTAGDLFNIAYTDTGTNSVLAWTKANVEFASGHGNFHGSAHYLGTVCDVASTTLFQSLHSSVLVDGASTEADTEWKTYAYDSFEALQVRVTANARNNDSVFKNRINGGDGTAVITFGSGVTGLITATGLGDAITAGQTVNTSITLGTGVQDLTVSLIVGTFKSSTNKSEIFAGAGAGRTRTASSTAHYFPIGGTIPVTLASFTEAQARIKPGFAAVVSNLRCYLSANTYTGDGTLKLYQNGVAVMTTTLTAAGGAGWYENTSDTITIDDDDELSFEFDEGTSGSITIHSVGITFAPVADTTIAGFDEYYSRFIGRIDGVGASV